MGFYISIQKNEKILNQLSTICSGDDTETNQLCPYESLGIFIKEFQSILECANSSVDIMGVTLFEFLNDEVFRYEVEKAIRKRKIDFRILILNPSHPIFKYLPSNNISWESYNRWLKYNNKIKNTKSNRGLEIRIYNEVPVLFLMIIDGKYCYFYPYLTSIQNNPIIGINMSEKSALSAYNSHFDYIWTRKNPSTLSIEEFEKNHEP
jgi:hypothetical protein